jgi:hypothetical protein
MKKYFLKCAVFILFIGLFSNCEEDKVIYDGSQSLAAFVTTTGSLAVAPTGISSINIPVEISTLSTTDRAIVVAVDPISTALASQYNIDSATLKIPAGSYTGNIVVTGNFANLVVGTTVKLILNLSSLGDAALETNSKKFELSIYKSCPLTNASSFNGNYKITVDGWQDYAIGATVPVVYNAANGLNTFRILSTTNPSITNPGVPYLIVTINPATATVVSITSNTFYNYGGGQTATVTAGSGTLSACTGDMNLKVTWGTNGTYNFNLVKL